MKQPLTNCNWREKALFTKISLGVAFAVGTLLAPAFSWAQEKPNILVIWGDDIGFWNISAINNGMMGYRTPNIDRLAEDGMWFTDY